MLADDAESESILFTFALVISLYLSIRTSHCVCLQKRVSLIHEGIDLRWSIISLNKLRNKNLKCSENRDRCNAVGLWCSRSLAVDRRASFSYVGVALTCISV